MLLVAHRTPPSRVECNRLAAAGANVFEVDVQIDDRDRAVVSHYFPLRRFGLVQRDNWRLRWHSGGACDPRLDEFAGYVPDECRLLLDLKERGPARRARLRSALITSSVARERYVVCSPYSADLAEFRAAGFGTWRTAGTAAELADVFSANRLPDDAVTIRHSLLTAELLGRLHDRVPAVVAWTVNDPGRAARLCEMGVDGITTDRGTVLRALSRPN